MTERGLAIRPNLRVGFAAVLVPFLGCQGPPEPPTGACPPRGPPADYLQLAESTGIELFVLSPDFRGNPVAVFDADGDGLDDIVSASRLRGFALYRNLGDLKFADVTAEVGLAAVVRATAIASADLDNDGDPELVIADREGWRVFANNAGRFDERAAIADVGATELIVPVDVDGDGLLDLFAANHDRDSDANSMNRLIGNNGDLGFEDRSSSIPASPSWSWAATAADFDGDGATDLYVANDTLTADFGDRLVEGVDRPVDALLINRRLRTAEPTFVDRAADLGLATPRSSMSGVVADLDRDGDLDLLIADYGANKLMTRDGGKFVDRAGVLGLDPATRIGLGCGDKPDERCLLLSWGAAIEDLDLDGELETIAVNGAVIETDPPPPILVFDRGDDGRYRELSPAVGCLEGHALIPADLDNDGDLDLIVGPREGRVQVIENTTAPASWLRVRLAGEASNREGRGARIAVLRSDGAVITRVVAAGGVPFSSAPAYLHVGLGAHDVESVEIRWPSGLVETFGPLEGDVTLVEGSAR